MKTDNKHFKFINSQTGYTIFYHSISNQLNVDEVRAELEKVKAQVATQNKLPASLVYWEETKNET